MVRGQIEERLLHSSMLLILSLLPTYSLPPLFFIKHDYLITLLSLFVLDLLLCSLLIRQNMTANDNANDSKLIRIKTSDEKEFHVEKKVISQCNLIKGILEDLAGTFHVYSTLVCSLPLLLSLLKAYSFIYYR